jgi:hypothetical protein
MRARFWISAAAVIAAVLSGCGASTAPPRVARADAAPLLVLSHRIVGETACAQARDIRTLQRRALRLADANRIPPPLEPTLLAGVRALGARTPPCVPVVTAVSPSGPGRSHGHGRGHGQGDGGGD